MCNSALHKAVTSSRPPPYSEVDPASNRPACHHVDRVVNDRVGCRVVELDSTYASEIDSDEDEDEEPTDLPLPPRLPRTTAQSLIRPYIFLNSASIAAGSGLLWLHVNGYIDLLGHPANVVLALLVFAACMQVGWMEVVMGTGEDMTVDRNGLVALVAVTFVGYVGGICWLL